MQNHLPTRRQAVAMIGFGALALRAAPAIAKARLGEDGLSGSSDLGTSDMRGPPEVSAHRDRPPAAGPSGGTIEMAATFDP